MTSVLSVEQLAIMAARSLVSLLDLRGPSEALKSSAVNHGGHTMSLTAPSTAAQTRLLVAAYRRVCIDPDTVTYLEAHGTGTRSGDRVEMGALWRAFTQLYAEAGRPLPKTKRIGVGSVKTNVGHLEAAAGIAGLLKVLLAMKHGELPASLHCHEVSPSLKLDEGPFFVQHQKTPWQGVLDPSLGRVLRAGVSSFGSGGSNAHVVLEWRDLGATRAAVRGPGEQLLVLSAPDPAALQAYASRLARALDADERIQLPSVAYTLQVGREELAERLAIVAGDRAAAVAALVAFARGEVALPPIYRGTAVRRANGAGERPAASGALAALAQRWVGGGAIDWVAFWPDGTPERASLPSFPFTKVRHWFDAPAATAATEPPRAPVEPTRAGAAAAGGCKAVRVSTRGDGY